MEVVGRVWYDIALRPWACTPTEAVNSDLGAAPLPPLPGPLLDSDLEQVLQSSRYLPNLVIKANILGADQAYTFRVEATDSTGTGTATSPQSVRSPHAMVVNNFLPLPPHQRRLRAGRSGGAPAAGRRLLRAVRQQLQGRHRQGGGLCAHLLGRLQPLGGERARTIPPPPLISDS